MLLIGLFISTHSFSQQTFTVSDSMPVMLNGLKAGYTITDESQKDVGKKGEMSRYKIYFYLTNTTSEAKIMYKKPGFMGHIGPLSGVIALFKCSNATGARLTNKMASMELQPCKIEATVEEKDCNSEKIIQTTKMVDLGFWIKPGETVSRTYPMYFSSNQKPNVTIVFYSEVANQTGTFLNAEQNQPASSQGFVRIKNMAGNTYLHDQNGPATCGAIDLEWWSAQWEIIPVTGSNYFNIRNRWKNNYLSSDNNSMMTDNNQSQAAMWSVDETSANTYTIKNAANNLKLVYQNGNLTTSNTFGTPAYSQWVIEQQ